MIRQNNLDDDFTKIQYGSLISYPAGKKHIYQDFLVLGKTEKTITTVPILQQEKYHMHYYDIPLTDSANDTLGNKYFISTLNVVTIPKNAYNQLNGIHITDLKPEDTKVIDQKSAHRIASARKAYRRWLSIETSNTSIDKKHQLLRRGLKKHTVLSATTLQKYRLGKNITGKTTETKFQPTAYFDQTYDGSIAKQETVQEQARCQKYADVDKLRKYDVIRYRAITGSYVKWRPFLVVNQNGKNVDLVPITHTNKTDLNVVSGNGIYSVYHQSLSPKISQAISILNGDPRDKAAHAKTNLAPCQEISVDLTEFKQRQLPQYLGNLTNYVNQKELTNMDNEKDQLVSDLMTSYNNYDTEIKAFGHIRNYKLKMYNRQSISLTDLQAVLNHSGSGEFKHEINMHPITDQRYLNIKKADALTYGIYQTIPSDNNQKVQHKQKQAPVELQI